MFSLHTQKRQGRFSLPNGFFLTEIFVKGKALSGVGGHPRSPGPSVAAATFILPTCRATT